MNDFFSIDEEANGNPSMESEHDQLMDALQAFECLGKIQDANEKSILLLILQKVNDLQSEVKKISKHFPDSANGEAR